MKRLLILTILYFCCKQLYSQTDSTFLKSYDQKILENSKLKSDLQTERQNLSILSDTYKKDTLALRKQIKDLLNEVFSEKQKVSDLNKSIIKKERDNLQTKVESLNTEISKLNQTIADKDKQITNEKAKAKTTSDNSKNDGKTEALASIVNLYKSRTFDELIQSGTMQSVARDMQLVGNIAEVIPVFNDLTIYYKALELLSKKFDASQIKDAQVQLSQIKLKSKMLETLKIDVESYQDFNTELKETIKKLVKYDKDKSASGDAVVQKMKFNEIVTILADYIYNYYDYVKYPYLSDIMLEIVKRKKSNADVEISDLLMRL